MKLFSKEIKSLTASCREHRKLTKKLNSEANTLGEKLRTELLKLGDGVYPTFSRIGLEKGCITTDDLRVKLTIGAYFPVGSSEDSDDQRIVCLGARAAGGTLELFGFHKPDIFDESDCLAAVADPNNQLGLEVFDFTDIYEPTDKLTVIRSVIKHLPCKK